MGLTSDEYRTLKESSVTGLTGSSLTRINLISLTALTTYALWAALRLKRPRLLDSALLQFALLVLPLLLSCTLFSSAAASSLFNAALSLACLGVLRLRAQVSAVARDASSAKARAAQLAEPMRISIDSAGDAAHAAANAPTRYESPDNVHRNEKGKQTQSQALGLAFLDDDPTARRTSVPDLWPLKTGSPHTDSTQPQPSSPASASASASTSSLHTPGATSSSQDHSIQWRNEDRNAIATSRDHIPRVRSPLGRGTSDSLSGAEHELTQRLARSAASTGPDGDVSPLLDAASGAATPLAAQAAPVPRSRPFLTVYRAHMMLMTLICILAVDFPRVFDVGRDAKCESWGVSVMDLGVGSFVFSLGLINAAPLLRAQTRYEPVRASLLREVRKALPLLLLGGARVIAVKGSHYQEHLSEYGVHWNFFITLALLPPLATILRPLARQRNARWSVIGMGIGVAYEILLRLTSLQSYALAPGPRTSLFSANKEGVVSLAGYLALYLIGLDVGHYVLPLDPYYAYRRASASRNKPKYEKLCEVLASLSLLFWMAYGLLALVSPAGRVASRRLANLPYVIWVSAFNVSFLLGYVAIFLALVEWPASTANRAVDDASTRQRLRASRRKARDNSSDEDSMEEEAEDALRGLEHERLFEASRAQSKDGIPGQPLVSAPTSYEDSSALALNADNASRSLARATAPAEPRTPALLEAINAQGLHIFLAGNLLTGLVNLTMRTLFVPAPLALVILLLYLAACSALALEGWRRGWKMRL
ncbi:hypothetical protein IE81DRAFT_369404 [Ceraceosorus guamensis]|uniref:GPI-anchored wall transfer protein 1 n=1 Tax=Ceraceosorus guamensis TaxID=1522189 RepID=A0A316VNZ2_9BASI|nr:hypothetical protein IE81DRAFT_369404 [Ceraceosorus guamensis]PWN39040.1 hypothetical protein IE81DRAFT_369404 [Ceraceosorus guamensis]